MEGEERDGDSLCPVASTLTSVLLSSQTAINAVRAQTRFRTFAALAANGGVKDGETEKKRHELISSDEGGDEEEDDEEFHDTVEGDELTGENGSPSKELSSKLEKTKLS